MFKTLIEKSTSVSKLNFQGGEKEAILNAISGLEIIGKFIIKYELSDDKKELQFALRYIPLMVDGDIEYLSYEETDEWKELMDIVSEKTPYAKLVDDNRIKNNIIKFTLEIENLDGFLSTLENFWLTSSIAV
ncbi:MAG: hypothetical protein PHD20_00520 [Clostridia bacterium]|nr:hypothetical protein [Clostridia bacterium]